MRIVRVPLVALSLLLAGSVAYADDKDQDKKHQDDKDKDKDKGAAAGQKKDDDKDKDKNKDAGAKKDDDDDGKDDDKDAGPAVDSERTPAQVDFRKKVLDRQHALVDELAKGHGKKVGQEERQQVGVHWRHVMRLLRIRELAERAKDAATLKKVDDLMERADKKFRAKLGGAPAPAASAAATDAGKGGAK